MGEDDISDAGHPKKPKLDLQYNVTVTNKFGLLIDNPTNKDAMDVSEANATPATTSAASQPIGNKTAQDAAAKTNKKIKIPPIIITNTIADFTKIMKKLKEMTSGGIETKYNPRHGLKIQLYNTEDYESVLAFLKELDVRGHTHPQTKDKHKNIVLKGLPPIALETIKQELESAGLQPTKITTMKQKAPEPHRSPMFLIQFKSEVNLNDVRKVKVIHYVKVKWEKYDPKIKITQCHRCQDRGHGTNGCFNPPRCAKCDQGHLTSECKKLAHEKAFCVNCKGDHRANSRMCPEYIKRVKMIEQQRALRSQHVNKHYRNEVPILNTRNYPILPTPQPTPRAWQQQHQQHQRQQQHTTSVNSNQNYNEFQELLSEIQKLNSLCNITKMLALVKLLNAKMEKAQNPVEKLQIFSEIVQNGDFY